MQCAPHFSHAAKSEALRRPTDARPKRARSRLGRVVVRAGLRVGAFLLVATAFVGFLHTKPGHPLLMRLAGIAGCPMGGASARQVDAARRAAVARIRGNDPAPARPALGFRLDETTLVDVRAWAQRAGVDCTEEREQTLVKCANVESAAIGRPVSEGTIAELAFDFAPEGPLASVTTLYSHRTADDTVRIATDIRDALTQALGPAHRVAGSFARSGTTAVLEYRFRDYAIDLTTSPVPGSGFAVREQYTSAL